MAKKELYTKQVWDWIFPYNFMAIFLALILSAIVGFIGFGLDVGVQGAFQIFLIEFFVLLPIFLFLFLFRSVQSLSLLRDEERILGVKFKERNDYNKKAEERDWFVYETRDSFCILHRDFIKDVRSIHHEKIQDHYQYVLTFQDITNRMHTIILKDSPKAVKDFRQWYGSTNQELEEWDPEELAELIGAPEEKKKKKR